MPFITIEEYSRLTGIPINTVRDYIKKGKVIIKNKDLPGEKPLINLLAMYAIAIKEAEEKLKSLFY